MGFFLEASASDFEHAISLYGKGKLEDAATELNAVLTKDPNDLKVRYYLANTYARLGQRDKAIEQYTFCAKAAPGTRMEQLCNKAMGLLNAKPSGISELKNPEKYLQLNAEKKIDAQAEAYRSNLQKQRDDEIKGLGGKTRNQIDTINRYLSMDINNVPRMIYVGARSYNNPYYRDEVERLKSEAAQKVNDLQSRMEKEAKSIGERFDKRLDEIKESHEGMRNALKSAKGNMQLTPHGTSMYVRNYINFGQETVYEPPVALQARPISISEPPPQLNRAEKIRLLRKQMTQLSPYQTE